MSEKRTENFQRNMALEELLISLNGDLQPSEKVLLEQCAGKQMEYPLVLIMGALRSGSTLFTQWLANTGLVACPTNLLSRFYQAPILGAKIQQLLTDPRFNFRDELGEFTQQVEYRSENGKTKGVLAPNEFWYFWRRFLAEPARDVWSDDELRQTMDVKTMKAELIGMMNVFQKPFAAKGMLFNYNIPFFDSIFDKVIFVHIQRDVAANAESVLQARERQFGSREVWYSFDIPEKEKLLRLSPEEQAVGQVCSINRAIFAGLQGVEEHRKLSVHYEDFCKNPETIFEALKNNMLIQGYDNDLPYTSEKVFQVHHRNCSEIVKKACYQWNEHQCV